MLMRLGCYFAIAFALNAIFQHIGDTFMMGWIGGCICMCCFDFLSEEVA